MASREQIIIKLTTLNRFNNGQENFDNLKLLKQEEQFRMKNRQENLQAHPSTEIGKQQLSKPILWIGQNTTFSAPSVTTISTIYYPIDFR